MALAPSEVAAYAGELARVFGCADPFEPATTERGCHLLRARLVTVLADLRPLADGPSIAEALRPLADDANRGLLGGARSMKMLAELQALFVQASFRRTKRAERGRLFAQLVVLFGLEPALGVIPDVGSEVDAGSDPEAHLRRVRRALRKG